MLLLLLLLCGQQPCSQSLCRSARSCEPFLWSPAKVRLPVIERGTCGPTRGGAGRGAATIKATCAPPCEYMWCWAGAQQVACTQHTAWLSMWPTTYKMVHCEVCKQYTTWWNGWPASIQHGSGRGLQLTHNMVKHVVWEHTILSSMRSANDTTPHGQTGGLQTHTMVQEEACN